MAVFTDARIAVALAGPAPGQALPVRLIADGAALLDVAPLADAHPPGCRCGPHRSDVARAFDAVFVARVRGEVPFFARLTAACADADAAEAVRQAVAGDPVVAMRFRLA